MSNHIRVRAKAKPDNRRPTTLNLMCSTCKHAWQDQILQPIKPSQFRTKFSALPCPNCGKSWVSHRVAIPTTYGKTIPLREYEPTG